MDWRRCSDRFYGLGDGCKGRENQIVLLYICLMDLLYMFVDSGRYESQKLEE